MPIKIMNVDDLKTAFYTVIFTTVVAEKLEGFTITAERMETLAKKQKGYLGIESARSKIGITVSNWQTLSDILAGKLM
jgi:heme-degrading monooxygenase HmoA